MIRCWSLFSQLPRCVAAHFRGREIGALVHEARLILLAQVKPFRKCQKTDMANAEAICKAALRPTMRFVPVKSEEFLGGRMVFGIHEPLIRLRMQAIDAVRENPNRLEQLCPANRRSSGDRKY